MNYELGIRKRKSLLRCHIGAVLKKTSSSFNNSTIQQFNNCNFLSKLPARNATHSVAGGQIPNSRFQLSQRGGYALMLSIVVSSIVLSIGISLLNIVQKELILSATGRDSQFAFYAADAGLECVLYWDLGNPGESIFPESSIDDDGIGNYPPSDTECGNTDLFDEADWRAEIIDVNNNYSPAHEEDGESVPASGYEDDIVEISFQVEFTAAEEGVSPGSC